MPAICKGECPCKNTKCPRNGNCAQCIEQHRKTPPQDIVACQREKARLIYTKQDREQLAYAESLPPHG